MKKFQTVLALLVVALIAVQGAALAGTVSGTIKSVDSEAKSLVVATETGESTVSYGDTTKWPEGVTDPSTLVDSKVAVTTDDVTGAATDVAKA